MSTEGVNIAQLVPLVYLCRAALQPERIKVWNAMGNSVPDGYKLGWTCATLYCGDPEHMCLIERKDTHWHNWKPMIAQVDTLEIGQFVEFPALSQKDMALFRSRLAMHFSLNTVIRTSKDGQSFRVYRVEQFEGLDVYSRAIETQKMIPVVYYPPRQLVQRPIPVGRKHCQYLGLIAFDSLHVRDFPKYEHCHVKACAFPANGNGKGLCHHHFHFFDYKISRLGRHIDMGDIYGKDESEAPRFHVDWFWKHEKARFKFENKGATTSWCQQVKSEEDVQIIVSGERIDKRAKYICTQKRPYASKEEADLVLKDRIGRQKQKPREGAEQIHSYECPDCKKWHIGNERPNWVSTSYIGRARTSMQSTVPGLQASPMMRRMGRGSNTGSSKTTGGRQRRAGGNNTYRQEDKPIKRWSRETLEMEADKILTASGFPEMVQTKLKEDYRIPGITNVVKEEARRVQAERDNGTWDGLWFGKKHPEANLQYVLDATWRLDREDMLAERGITAEEYERLQAIEELEGERDYFAEQFGVKP